MNISWWYWWVCNKWGILDLWRRFLKFIRWILNLQIRVCSLDRWYLRLYFLLKKYCFIFLDFRWNNLFLLLNLVCCCYYELNLFFIILWNICLIWTLRICFICWFYTYYSFIDVFLMIRFTIIRLNLLNFINKT